MVKKFLQLEIVAIAVIFLNYWPILNQHTTAQLSTPRIVILDIGQGDSTLLQTRSGKFGLIDTGKSSSIISKLEKYIPYNKKQIEFLLLTHPDSDHIGMYEEISKRYEINKIFINKTTKASNAIERIKNNILAKKIPNFSLFEPNDFWFDDFYIDILWPLYPSSSKEYESNEYSISANISFGEFDFITMGDLGSYVEDDLVDYLPSKSIEVLKISHHGSKNSTSVEFLQKLAPKIALISTGKNSYGHPHKEVLDRLEDKKIPYMSTVEDGDLVITPEKTGIYTIN